MNVPRKESFQSRVAAWLLRFYPRPLKGREVGSAEKGGQKQGTQNLAEGT